MRAPQYPQHTPAPDSRVARTAVGQCLSVLLVEDDRADALLVEELIADAAADITFAWAQSISHAERELARARPDCVLLDLNLPDANGIDALERIGRWDPSIPIVVLTGLNDEHFGISAVASGAQDYLVKGRVEPDSLRRSLLYAIERKHAELTAVELHASQLRAGENARLERGLQPSPLLLDEAGVDIITKYRPSREDALLGGDFYDAVQTPDGTVHVMIGDVAGHGPDEAALAPDSLRFNAVRAGHPGMLVHGPDDVQWLEPLAGPALGLGGREWPVNELELPEGHGLLLLTDGLFEGHSGQGNKRLGEDGLLEVARSVASLPGRAFVDALIEEAETLAGSHGGLTDDIAVVRVERITR
jgi:CheY-like chemotaxis protein